jgi:hypothetical protein
VESWQKYKVLLAIVLAVLVIAAVVVTLVVTALESGESRGVSAVEVGCSGNGNVFLAVLGAVVGVGLPRRV